VPEGSDETIAALGASTIQLVQQHFEKFEFSKGLEAVWGLIAAVDKFIVQNAPWKLARQTDQAAQIDTLTTKQELDKQANQIAMDRKDLESKKALFQLEQKHAVEKVASNAQLASEKLTNQKNSMSDGEKTAKVAHHLAVGALAQIDQRVIDAVNTSLDMAVSGIKQIEDKVGSTHSALLRRIEQDRKDVDMMMRKLAAPRKSKAVRDETGRIASVVSEPVKLDA
jgi:hypothetical protein